MSQSSHPYGTPHARARVSAPTTLARQRYPAALNGSSVVPQRPLWFRLLIRVPARAWLFLLVALFGFAGVHTLSSKHAAAETLASQQALAAAAAAANRQDDSFNARFEALAEANPQLDLSVSVIAPNGRLAHFGSSATFDGASTAKLLTAVTFLQKVEAGHAKLSTVISGRPAAYWLNVMLVNSDDTAWTNLNGYLTHAQLERTAADMGIKDYDADTNSLSSADIAHLLFKLQTGDLLSDSHRDLMLADMKQANFRQFIVAGASKGTTVYHKIGMDEDNVHDAALIKRADKTLTLVIFSNGHGTYDWNKRADLFIKLTQSATATYLP